MLTPQEVSTHAFTKQVMGGYSMAMVDEFLDELTDDYTSLYKENAALKAKLKVLVEKVEDYRATEDSMRATLLTAQKMADSIVHEAEEKRDAVLAQAEQDARAKLNNYQASLQEMESRLRAGQNQLAEFINASRTLCGKQLEFLDSLPELPVEMPVEPMERPKVEDIEEQVLSSFAQEPQPPVEMPKAEEPAVAVPAAAPVMEQPSVAVPQQPVPQQTAPQEPVSALEGDGEPTRRIDDLGSRLNDLKFGRNYSAER